MIDLDPKYLNEIKGILSERIPNCDVLVFGSRVKGTARKYSDIDLVVICGEKLDWGKLEALKDAFSESDLPIIVDVVDWNAISDAFKKVIQETGTEKIQSKDSIEASTNGNGSSARSKIPRL